MPTFSRSVFLYAHAMRGVVSDAEAAPLVVQAPPFINEGEKIRERGNLKLATISLLLN